MQFSGRRRWSAALTVFALLGAAVMAQGFAANPAHADVGAFIQPVSGKVTGMVGVRCALDGTPSADPAHRGHDIASNAGQNIVAAAAGVVEIAGSYSGYGQTVSIRHAAGYSTLYGHMITGSILVSPGDVVAQGTVLGRVGNTGNSFGEHLHFEVRTPTNAVMSLGSYSCNQTVTRGVPIPVDIPGLGSGTPIAPPADRDGDGVPDAFDTCPDVRGFSAYAGCPIPRTANSTDFNGDGKADAFYANPNGQWWASDSASGPWHTLNNAGVPVDGLQFADFNGDGKTDVFWPNPNGQWWVSYSGTSGWSTLNNALGASGETLQLGDFNGDGKADVFWPHPNGEWRISYGGNTAWTTVSTSVPTTDIRVADFNGDGKDDIFWAHPSGQWWVSDSATSPWHTINNAGVPVNELKFGDLNGDAKDDVFWANPSDGRWYVSYGGTGAWTVSGVNNIPLQGLQLADVTGDGAADVFWQNTGAGQWWISQKGTSGWKSISNTNVNSNLLIVR